MANVSEVDEKSKAHRPDDGTMPTLRATEILSAREFVRPPDISQLRRPNIEDLREDGLLYAVPRKPFGETDVPFVGNVYLLSRLGRGGMGAVYYGWSENLAAEVAVKILPPGHEIGDDCEERFRREGEIARGLDSPHLVKTFDLGHVTGISYLVLEYVDGCSARQVLERAKEEGRPGLDEFEALTLVRAAAAGLAVAHRSGVIHRDIKPDNIFCVRDPSTGQIDLSLSKVGDLGIARDASQGATLTATNVAIGTPGFMAPEQATDSKRAQPASDVFSLGATLYSLIAGQAPFSGHTAVDVLLNTMRKAPVPIRTMRPEVSLPTAQLIARLLDKSPERRPRDGTALLEVLDQRIIELGGHETGATLIAPMPRAASPNLRPPTPGPTPTMTIEASPPPLPAAAPVARLPEPPFAITPPRRRPAIPRDVEPQPLISGRKKPIAEHAIDDGDPRGIGSPGTITLALMLIEALLQIFKSGYSGPFHFVARVIHHGGHLICNTCDKDIFTFGGVLLPLVVAGIASWKAFEFKKLFFASLLFPAAWIGTAARQIASIKKGGYFPEDFEVFEPAPHDWAFILRQLGLTDMSAAVGGLVYGISWILLGVSVVGFAIKHFRR